MPKLDHSANLLQNQGLSPEELRERQSRGGVKSGEVRRKKRDMKNLARQILDTPLATDDDIRAALKDRGIPETEAAAVLLAQLRRARTGDTEAARFLRDTSGQKPVENVQIGNLDDKPFETLDLTKLSDEQLRSLANPEPEPEDPDAL